MAWLAVLHVFCLAVSGQKLRYGSVSFVSEWILRLNGPNPAAEKSFSDGENLFRYVKKQIDNKANSGYPFAAITFDTLHYPAEKKVVVVAKLDEGPFVVQGAVVQEGDTSIPSALIAKALRIKKDLPFSYRRFQMLPLLIRQLGFAEMVKNPELEFFGNQAVVHVFLVRRKASYFTGILGILPGSETGGGTILTGNIDAGFVNLFNKGVTFDLKWNRFAPQSQMAEINVSVPYLFFNGLSVESGFELFRQDSAINRRRAEIRISSSPGSEWKYTVGYKSLASSGFESLQGNSRIRITNRAASLTFQKLFPIVSGIDLQKRQFSFSLIPVLKTLEAPESAEKNYPQLETSLAWKYPFRFPYRRFVVQTSGSIQTLYSERITLQDQYRIGGNNSVRGFNENFFYTTQHALISVQPQFLVDNSLLVGVFSDAFFFNSGLNNQFFSHTAWALGFGIAAELDLGNNLVRISLANGFTEDIPLDFQTTKIHFGYFARF